MLQMDANSMGKPHVVQVAIQLVSSRASYEHTWYPLVNVLFALR